MSVQPAVRIASGKISTLAYLSCILLAGASPMLATRSPALHADQIRLTPKIDLHLEPVPIEGLPDRTLNLPPGFKVELFSDQVDKAHFMAWDDQGSIPTRMPAGVRSPVFSPLIPLTCGVSPLG